MVEMQREKKADLSGANLRHANLSGRVFIYADTIRQYILYVIEADVTMFIAGCRTFTYSEAIDHWTTESIQPEYIAAIRNYIESKKNA